MITLICLGSAASIAIPATLQPLKVKTGLWQMTATIAWSGLPPQLQGLFPTDQTHNYQSCVKAEDLSSNPWAEGSDDGCAWTVVASTGTDMEVKGTGCHIGQQLGMTAEAHGKIHVVDSQDGTGSFDLTMTGNGQTVRGRASYTGKWVAPTCPAE